jgi:hypothetical protein
MLSLFKDARAKARMAALAAANLIGKGAVFGFGLCASVAIAQQFTIPDLATVIGHISYLQPGAVPVGTTCTIAAGSTDAEGSCATTSTAAVVTFGRTWGVAPFCIVYDASAVSATSMPVYTVSATAITLSTVITAHTLFWHCAGKTGSA